MRGNALISDRRVRGEHGRVFSLVSENNINRSIVKILIAEGEDGVWAGTAPFRVWATVGKKAPSPFAAVNIKGDRERAILSGKVSCDA